MLYLFRWLKTTLAFVAQESPVDYPRIYLMAVDPCSKNIPIGLSSQ